MFLKIVFDTIALDFILYFPREWLSINLVDQKPNTSSI